MFKRALIVGLCYLFSSLGFFYSLAGALEEFNRPSGNISHMLMAVSWVVAWCIHMLMCFTWILNIRLGKPLPYFGCILGIVSLLSFASLGMEMFKGVPGLGILITIATSFVAAIVVSPAIFLALHMTKFHGRLENNA